VPSITAAQSSIDRDAWVENTIGSPSDDAASATATSAPGCAISRTPTGARSTGAGSRRPNSSTDVSRAVVSRIIRGTTDQRPNASVLARAVRS
jgi:hypothetical protein